MEARTSSPDVIAIRVLPNPNHFGVLRWYKQQNFKGAPQSMAVDGYEAIRDGRTVYVNAANISSGVFYTNIYLIACNQKAEDDTVSIFRRILSHWKFNNNLVESGVCSQNTDKFCLYNHDCPGEKEYCLSRKAKVIRDTKRLADLEEIKIALNNYLKDKGKYPSLSGGTYIPNISMSVWPSWKSNLFLSLGIKAIYDPINKLGDCGDSRFNPITCWDEHEKEFADYDREDPDINIPSGSYVYVYSSDKYGTSYNVCGTRETEYIVNDSFENCKFNQLVNSPPHFLDSNLTGKPKYEFKGFISATDPDNDILNWSINFFNPSSRSAWESMGWKWADGVDGFKIIDVGDPMQKEFYALEAGLANISDEYQVQVMIEDGRGGSASKNFNIHIGNHLMTLNNINEEVIIGQSNTFSLEGTDNSLNPITSLILESSSLDGSPINIADYNLSLTGASLDQTYNATQRTGQYVLNVYALDPTTGNRLDSKFEINIINNPPIINSANIIFGNTTTQTCDVNNCSFAIDNQENAKIEITASDDDDGHVIEYSIVNNPGGLVINNMGLLTGFENLNALNIEQEEYSFQVQVRDQYCAQSSPVECMDSINFTVKVMPFCSVDIPASAHFFNATDTQINTSGETIPLGDVLSDCSSAGNSSVDISITGNASSQAIVIVMDLSNSMRTIVNGEAAVDTAKKTLTADGGVLDKLSEYANTIIPTGHTIEVGIVGYNSEVLSPAYSLANIAEAGITDEIKTIISNFNANAGTHTLDALNEAELMLESITNPDVEKIIILISDGHPVIRASSETHECVEDSCGCGRFCDLSSDKPGTCFFSGNFSDQCCDSGRSWCNSQHKCCDGTPSDANWENCCWSHCYSHNECPFFEKWPGNCTHEECWVATPDTPCGGCGICISIPEPTDCKCGIQNEGTCSAQCRTDCVSQKKSDFKIAITEQTECISGTTGPQFPECRESTAFCNNWPSCDTGCSWSRTIDVTASAQCDISFDTGNQAENIKNLGIEFYTIFFDTQGDASIGEKMCAWSSEEASDCPVGGNYAFAGTEINIMFDKVLSYILIKPKNIEFNTLAIIDPSPFSINTLLEDHNIDEALTCGTGNSEIVVNYDSDGFIDVENLIFYYCDQKLHP